MGFFDRFLGNEYDRDLGPHRDRDRIGRQWGYGAGVWGAANRDYGRFGYDRGLRSAGYDRDYHSRWHTDYGDPFGDRVARTPMRMIRGGNRANYDRSFSGPRYDRDMHEARDYRWAGEGGRHRGYDRDFNGFRSNRYDSGWF